MKFRHLAFFLTLPLLAQAENIEELAQSYNSSKQELLASETKKREVLASLYKISRTVRNISKQKNNLTDELLGTQVRIQSLSQNIVGLEALTEQQRTRLKQRLRVLYKFSGQGFVKGLFSNSSFPELDRFLKFTRIVSERDYKLLREFKQNISTYQAQKKKLTKETKRLMNVKGRIKSQEDQLSAQNANTRALLAQVDAERLKNLRQMTALRSKTASMTTGEKVDAALLKMFEPSFFEQKGSLNWPVAGTIAQKFGYTTDEVYPLRLGHKGIFFHSMPKAFVLSSFAGKAAFSGHLEGYGKVLILDHGHHYYTVYATVSEVLVQKGDSIAQHQRIATSGFSEQFQKAGVYFEIRHFSEPEDPAAWLKSSGLKVSKK